MFSQTIAILAGAILALPPSLCCLLGSSSCCSSAKAEVTPTRKCCQQHAASKQGCQPSHRSTTPAENPDGKVCCCVKTAVPAPSVINPVHDEGPSLWTMVPPPQVDALAAGPAQEFVGPWVDLSPARHVRLCVWRC